MRTRLPTCLSVASGALRIVAIPSARYYTPFLSGSPSNGKFKGCLFPAPAFIVQLIVNPDHARAVTVSLDRRTLHTRDDRDGAAGGRSGARAASGLNRVLQQAHQPVADESDPGGIDGERHAQRRLAQLVLTVSNAPGPSRASSLPSIQHALVGVVA